jgi:hypothetical protein
VKKNLKKAFFQKKIDSDDGENDRIVLQFYSSSQWPVSKLKKENEEKQLNEFSRIAPEDLHR